MVFAEKQLGQSRDNDTSTHAVYTPSSVTGIIKTITLANTSGSAANIRVFIDNDGTTYDQSSALLYDTSIPANSTVVVTGYWIVENGGNVAYQQGTANAVTITVDGAETS